MALPRVPTWAGAVFGVALAARLAFLFLADQPLLYSHQYTYFTAALRIAEHPHALGYVLRSDEWRVWDQHWTIAPLYHVFAGAVFKLFGPHLVALRLVQCVLDALAAVGVAWLGRRVAGPRGLWAGVAYALYWPAIEMPTWTMTENAHTVLFVSAVVLLAREASAPSRRLAFAGGVLVGLSALARSVSTVFLGLAVLHRAYCERSRRGVASAALVLLGGLAVILPWTARNVFLLGEPVLIETAAFENIWYANHLVDRPTFLAQEREVHGQPTPAAKRSRALAFALEGIRQRPAAFADKVRANFWHFLRLEGLHNLLRIERSLEPWRHAGTVVLDDLLFVVCVPLFVVFAIAGRPSPARRLILAWCAYYVFMVVVVFHNEIRYRSAFVPFAFAGAAGGALLVASAAERGRFRVRLAAALGLALGSAMLAPYLAPAVRAVRAYAAVRRAFPLAAAGDNVGAWLRAELAATRDPRSPRPWLLLARHHAWGDRPQPALAALERARPLTTVANWSVAIARPRLWTALGQTKDGIRAARTLDTLSWDTDPWLVLEIAWRGPAAARHGPDRAGRRVRLRRRPRLPAPARRRAAPAPAPSGVGPLRARGRTEAARGDAPLQPPPRVDAPPPRDRRRGLRRHADDGGAVPVHAVAPAGDGRGRGAQRRRSRSTRSCARTRSRACVPRTASWRSRCTRRPGAAPARWRTRACAWTGWRSRPLHPLDERREQEQQEADSDQPERLDPEVGQPQDVEVDEEAQQADDEGDGPDRHGGGRQSHSQTPCGGVSQRILGTVRAAAPGPG